MTLNKNLCVIPTDKPSRLFIDEKILELDDECILSEDYWIENQNIYITSDEEIKFGDYGLGKNNSIYKFDETTTLHCVNLFECKKIILTTDQDLIKDGVQAIDDDFLEWFVKNPNCGNVKVEWVKTPDGIFYHKDNVPYGCYKIIIPKEEPTLANMKCICMRFEANCFSGVCRNCGFPPKEEHNYNMKEEIIAEMEKQETLDKLAENYLLSSVERNQYGDELSFIDGYKLAQERSYENMQEYADFCIKCDRLGLPCIIAKDWLEINKNK